MAGLYRGMVDHRNATIVHKVSARMSFKTQIILNSALFVYTINDLTLIMQNNQHNVMSCKFNNLNKSLDFNYCK